MVARVTVPLAAVSVTRTVDGVGVGDARAPSDLGDVLGAGLGAGHGVDRRVVDGGDVNGAGGDVGQVVDGAAVVDLEAGDSLGGGGCLRGVGELHRLEGSLHLGEGGPVARQRHGGAGEVAGDGVAADGREAQHVGAALERRW